MQTTTFFASIAMLAASTSTPILAGDREYDRDRQNTTKARSAERFDHGMQVVANSAAPEAPGYGWRYFSNPAARRAVVISPQGDYYYSRGKGLHWIAAEQSGS